MAKSDFADSVPFELEHARKHLQLERARLLTLSHDMPARSSAGAVLDEFMRAADCCAIEVDALLRQQKPANLVSTPEILNLRQTIAEARTRVEKQKSLVGRFEPMTYQSQLAEELLAIYEATIKILEDRLATISR